VVLVLTAACAATTTTSPAPTPLAGVDVDEPIVVSRITADHLTLDQREILTATLADYLRESLPNQILTQDAISRMIEEEQRKDLLGCDEVACYTEIAEKFGARYLIGGRVAELGSDIRAQVTLLDTGGIQEKIGQGDAPACEGLAPVAVLRAAADLLDRRWLWSLEPLWSSSWFSGSERARATTRSWSRSCSVPWSRLFRSPWPDCCVSTAASANSAVAPCSNADFYRPARDGVEIIRVLSGFRDLIPLL
jgi:hypothetical protein